MTAAEPARSSASLLLAISNWLPAATDAAKLSVDGGAAAGAWLVAWLVGGPVGRSAAEAVPTAIVPTPVPNNRAKRVITRPLIIVAPFAASGAPADKTRLGQ